MARNEKTPDTKPETKQDTWRLPTRIASDNGGNWTPLREHLAAWADAGGKLDVEPPDATTICCLSMPASVLRALETQAERLSKKHGKRYTAGYIARLVWDEWERS